MQTRRGLLKKTLGGAVLLAAAGAVPVALRRTKLAEPKAPLRFFTAAEYSIWAAVAERILARDVTWITQEHTDAAPLANVAMLETAEHRPAAPPVGQVDVAGKADAFLARLDPASAKDLKQLLALFDNALFSLLTGGPATPFTQLQTDEQDAQLRAWQTSRFALRRTGFQAMKRLCCAIYFGSPETYASIGYPGPPIALVRSALEGRAPERSNR
jgi:hypothetical protein